MRVLLLAVALILSACTAQKVPIGTGGDMDELRKSPCACGPNIQPRSQWVG
jgi:hypothetical protein